MRRYIKILVGVLLLGSLTSLLVGCQIVSETSQKNNDAQWIPLFNGKNLDDWIIKIKGSPLHENTLNTFRVEKGMLRIDYSNYKNFDRRFGHIFYKTPFSHYILQLEYRFNGEQVAGGPKWAYRNNGVMFHAQPPSTVELNQDFPISIETQLLGGNGLDERSTGNICTPDTHVVVNDILKLKHITKSNSSTYHGDQWVQLELEVHGDQQVIHRINGKEVLRYTQPQYDTLNKRQFSYLEKVKHLPLKSGYIALQAESHNTDFRHIRLKKLPIKTRL